MSQDARQDATDGLIATLIHKGRPIARMARPGLFARGQGAVSMTAVLATVFPNARVSLAGRRSDMKRSTEAWRITLSCD